MAFAWTKELGTPNSPATRFTRGTVFAATLVRNCYGLSGCWPPCTDLTGLPANGGFYFQAFDGSVTLPVAGYNYNSVWTPCMGLSLSTRFGRAPHFSSSVSLFDLNGPFLRPDPHFAHVGARRSCQGCPSRQLAACSALARPYLDSSEHDGPLGAVRVMTIRGEPACGRGSIAPQPCIRWIRGPEP